MANLTEVLAIVNDKGGVGKSTTAHNLACAILRERPKFRVLIIDLDAQEANVSRLCGWNPSEHPSDPTINEAMINKTSLPVYIASDPVGKYSHRLYICPSSSKLLYIAPFLQAELSPRHVLNRCLGQTLTIPLPDGTTQQASIQDAFDYIIIDCPPAMNIVTQNAIAAASGIIVPMQLEALPTLGSSSVIAWAEAIKKELNPNLEIRGILKTMVDRRSKVSQNFSDFIDERFRGRVFRTEIPRRVRIVEAQALLQDIFSYDPYNYAALAYTALAKEILSTAEV